MLGAESGHHLHGVHASSSDRTQYPLAAEKTEAQSCENDSSSLGNLITEERLECSRHIVPHDLSKRDSRTVHAAAPSFPKPCEGSPVILPILQMRDLSLRRVTQTASVHRSDRTGSLPRSALCTRGKENYTLLALTGHRPPFWGLG